MIRPFLVVSSVALLLAMTACGSDQGAGDSTRSASVKTGDSTCEVSKTDFSAGELTFDVENTGSQTTDVGIYAKGTSGAFDKVEGGVVAIAPGTSRDFKVKVSGGEYEVACMPGQAGDDIRAGITVSGKTDASNESTYDREIVVSAKDFGFTGLEGLTSKPGERIEFRLTNSSATMSHNLFFFDPSGKEIGGVRTLEAGTSGQVILSFTDAGTYTFRCTIGDHASLGMQGDATVA